MKKQIEKSILINASPVTVWENLTSSNLTKEWMGDQEIEIITYKTKS